jgi:hypothetical protein
VDGKRIAGVLSELTLSLSHGLDGWLGRRVDSTDRLILEIRDLVAPIP